MVPLRMNTGEKFLSAIAVMARSAFTLERAYSVLGSSGDSSVTTSAFAEPYMMQDEEKR